MKPPVCGEAETYYLLYFLKLLEVLNTTGKILQGNLFEVTVYSFDHSKYTKALAIKKQDLFDIKSNQYFSMGEQTFLIINSNLAGTLGKSVDWTPQYENTVSVKAIRPLMPSSTQTIQDIKSVISQTGIAFDHFSLEQAILFQTAFDELQKQLLLDIIISASHTLELPINEAAFRKNTAIPKYRTP